MKTVLSLLVSLQLVSLAMAKEGGAVFASVPPTIDPTSKYIFYLHGGIIQAKGIDAVSPYFGKYNYTGILEALSDYGYVVISEPRPEETTTQEYAAKVASQVGKLLKAKVPARNIVVVGASMGAGIAIDASIRLKNADIRFAVLGICKRSSWDSYLEHFPIEETLLYGDFLSIYETSDSYGSCEDFIPKKEKVSRFEEVELNMNLGHGFLYQPYEEWMEPLTNWIDRPEDMPSR